MSHQNVTQKSSSGVESSEDLKDILKVLSQEYHKSIQKMHKEFYKVIMDKEEEISHLRDHNQKSLLQLKKVKDKEKYNQNLEEENKYLQKKLLKNIEQNNHLKKRNQDLIDHILKLKYDEKAQDEMLRNLNNDKFLLEKESNTNLLLATIQKEVDLVKIQHPTHINAQKRTLVKENNIVKIPY